MNRFLLVGQTGVGKSSFINSTFGLEIAKTLDFTACTKVVEQYAYNTPYGNVCIIDTPGLAESTEDQDYIYLKLVKDHIDIYGIDVMIYVSRLDEVRFRPTEKRALQFITSQLGSNLWKESWLILTFAASVPTEKRDNAIKQRIIHIGNCVYELVSWFNGFANIGIIDNLDDDWTSDGIPPDKFLTSSVVPS